MRIACKTDLWGVAIDDRSRRTADGRVWNTTFQEILDSVRALGYDGFDCMDQDCFSPTANLDLFRSALRSSGLEFVSAWTWLLGNSASVEKRTFDPTYPEADARQYAPMSVRVIEPSDLVLDLSRLRELVRTMGGFGAQSLTVGGPLVIRGSIVERYYRMVGETLNELGEASSRVGVRLVCHPHLGSLFEFGTDIDKLYDFADESLVGLCFDPAHIAAGGGSPLDFVERYHRRIVYVHLKDLDLTSGRFVELGLGSLDLVGIVRSLRTFGYDGWLTAEMDVPSDAPFESARRSSKFLCRLR